MKVKVKITYKPEQAPEAAAAPAAEPTADTLRPWDTGPMRLARSVLGARRRPADRVPAGV